MKGRLVSGAITALLVSLVFSALPVRSAAAQTLQLQVDISQGVILDSRVSQRPYLFTLPLTAGVRFEVATRPRLGLSIAPTYVNPRWDLGIGAKGDLQIWSTFQDALGLRLGVDAQYLPLEAETFRVSGRFDVVVLEDVVHVGVVAGHDFARQRFYLGGSFGFELTALYKILRAPRPTPIPQIQALEVAEPTALELLTSDARGRALGVMPRERKIRGLCWVRAHASILEAAHTPEQLMSTLQRHGQRELSDALHESLAENRQPAEPGALASSLLAGLREAIVELAKRDMLTCE